MQSCCSLIVSAFPPIASASAAARRLRPLRISCCSRAQLLSASTAAPRLRPLPAAAPRLRPLQLLLHARRLRLLQLLLPITSASAAAPRLHPLRLLLPDCMHSLAAPAGFQPDVLKHSSRSSRFSKSSPAPRTSHFRHSQTHTDKR